MKGPGRGEGLALVGYRATGKSTVGRLVAARLGRPFVDADRELERRLGATIAAVFADRGEAAFRDAEEALLVELADRRPAPVLAAGGGAVERLGACAALRRFGFVAWLVADPAALADRLRRNPGGRPALTAAGTADEVAAVLARREPLYREVADAAIATDGLAPAEVADAVIRAFRPRPRDADPGRNPPP